MRKFWLALASVPAVLSVALTAHADTIVQQVNLAQQTLAEQVKDVNDAVFLSSNVPNGTSYQLTFSKFDPSLGTLNSATWSYNVTLFFGVKGIGRSFEDPESGTATDAYQAASGRGTVTLFNQSQFGQQLGTSSVDVGSQVLTAPSLILGPGQNIPTYSDVGFPGSTGGLAGTSVWNQGTPSNLLAFSGLGSDAFSLKVSGLNLLQLTCNVTIGFPPYYNHCLQQYGQGIFTSVTSTLTYDYTPVPEPVSGALLGVGLATLGWLRRTRPASIGLRR